MNVITESSVVAPATSVPSTIANPVLSDADQAVANLRAQLALAEEKLNAEKAALAAAAQEKRRAIIESIPGQLGVGSMKEAIALLSGATTTKRDFPNRLSDETRAQAKLMLENHATSAAVAKALKMGLSTVDLWKAKWGLTQPRKGRVTQPKQARRSSPASGHLSPAKRAKIVQMLKAPNARIAVVAKRANTSRQTCYAIRATIPELANAA